MNDIIQCRKKPRRVGGELQSEYKNRPQVYVYFFLIFSGGTMLSINNAMGIKVAIIVFAFLGIILFIMGIRRVWRRKIVAGSLEGLVGLLLLAIAALTLTISINLYTYDRLTHESKIAEISFQEIEPQHFAAIVTLKDSTKILDLRGDEWQIDARVLNGAE